MAKRKPIRRRQLPLRLRDDLVAAKPGEMEETFLPPIDRKSTAYKAGAEAKAAGRPRVMRNSLDWLAGYDEAPAPKRSRRK